MRSGFIVVSLTLFGTLAPGSQDPPPVFMPGTVAGEFRFDSGPLHGVFREGGASLGLTPVESAAREVEIAKTPGLLSYYRIFTTKHRHGESMRGVPSDAAIRDPKTLQVRWEPGEDRPFTLTATYRWAAPDTLDLETVVEAKADLPDFEVFLSSYSTELFPATQVYARLPEGGNGFMPADTEQGTWHMFPRDEHAVKLIQDGRWAIDPSPVEWVIRPAFAAPLLFRRTTNTNLAIVLMSRPEDCFAVATPCANEAHYSMYFSLFGRTLAAGETARAVTRMLVSELSDSAILARYEAFMRQHGE